MLSPHFPDEDTAAGAVKRLAQRVPHVYTAELGEEGRLGNIVRAVTTCLAWFSACQGLRSRSWSRVGPAVITLVSVGTGEGALPPEGTRHTPGGSSHHRGQRADSLAVPGTVPATTGASSATAGATEQEAQCPPSQQPSSLVVKKKKKPTKTKNKIKQDAGPTCLGLKPAQKQCGSATDWLCDLGRVFEPP